MDHETMAAWVAIASPTTSNQNRGFGPHGDPLPGHRGRIEPRRRSAATIIVDLKGGMNQCDSISSIRLPLCSSMNPSFEKDIPLKSTRSVDLDIIAGSCRADHSHFRSIGVKPTPPAHKMTSNGVSDSPKKPTRTVDVDTLPRIPCRNRSVRDFRRVRFDERGAREPFEYPGVDEELYPELYYSKREINDIRMSLKQKAKTLESLNRNVVSSILHLHGVTTHGDGPPLSDREAAQQLVQCGARGMEHFLTPRFCKHRKWAVHKILEVQQECEDEELDELLRKWSETLSSSSCHYARNVAMIDAREALRASMISSTGSSRSI